MDKETQSHEEWLNKIRKASNLDIKESEEEEKKLKIEEKLSFVKVFIPLLIFILALLVRICFIFYFTNTQDAGIGWYNDSYHHWQIAYLSKEIGFNNGFLRLWDLTGMEYFWGLLHPLLFSIFFNVFQTADILMVRLTNSLIGSLSILVLFLLIRREFNLQTALATCLIAIFNPVGIFTDTSGMIEPLAILLMLLGFYFWPQKAYLTGLFWALASMTRAEFWLFSMGLILIILFFDRHKTKRLALLGFYLLPVLVYIKYLLNSTGNAIYPIYWNFIGNAKGEWQKDIPLTLEQIQIRIILIVILAISIVIALFLIVKKPKFYLFSLLGVGNFMFLSFFIGLTEYLKSYLPRFWVDRIFWLPYLWLGFAVSASLFYYLSSKFSKRGIAITFKIFCWVLIVGIILATQLSWNTINHYRNSSLNTLNLTTKTARGIVSYYKGGSILLPGDDQLLTYELYKNGIKGRDIRGQMFDPYFYFEDPDPYANWDKRRTVVMDWLRKESIRLIAFYEGDNRYKKLVEIEKSDFKYLGKTDKLLLYEVNIQE